MTALLTFHDSLPLSLYVHLPWCVKKCPYCDFNSHEAGKQVLSERDYVDALIRDLDQTLPSIWGRRIHTLFIGGGTPSLFTAEALAELMAALRARLNLHPEIEVTLEANPGTAEAERFHDYRRLGVNRLSIGVQSFDDTCLGQLGRIHSAGEAHKAIELAQEAGFEEINLDLMFGLPGQNPAKAMQDLKQAVVYQPAHLSRYQLTIEPNTAFFSRPPILPEDEMIWSMQEQGDVFLSSHGYQHYEISAYARADGRCLHNLNYWQFGDYLGLGAGAHSKLTDVAAGSVTRFARHRLPDRYMALAGSDKAIVQQKQLDQTDLVLEFMMNALRLSDGIPSALFQQRTGLPLSVIQTELEEAEERGLLEWDIGSIKPTAKGQRYLNDLLQIFLTEPVEKRSERNKARS